MSVTRRGRAFAWIAAAVVALTGCGGDGGEFGGAGGGVVSDACVVNNTATLRFDNTSPSDGFSVILDGTLVDSVASKTSKTREVAAGIHSVGWLYAGTTVTACPTATSDVPACATQVFSCSAVDSQRCLHQNFGTVVAQNTHNFKVMAVLDGRPYPLDPFEGVSVNLEAGVAHEIAFTGPEGIVCSPVLFVLDACDKRIFRC